MRRVVPLPGTCSIKKLVILFTLALSAINFMAAVDKASAVLITFDYPQETPITDQYQEFGVVFSGEPQPPIIYPREYWGIDDPAIMGPSLAPSWGSSSIIITFVHPSDGSPAEAVNVNFSPYLLTRGFESPATFTFYDLNGGIISQQAIPPNIFSYTIPPKFHKFIFAPNHSYAWIDNLSYQLYQPACEITGPEVCNDGKDNDCDGKLDCLDSDCSADPLCFPRDCANIGD